MPRRTIHTPPLSEVVHIRFDIAIRERLTSQECFERGRNVDRYLMRSAKTFLEGRGPKVETNVAMACIATSRAWRIVGRALENTERAEAKARSRLMAMAAAKGMMKSEEKKCEFCGAVFSHWCAHCRRRRGWNPQ